MFSGLTKELGRQVEAVSDAVRTREFWIYLAIILALAGMAIGVVYVAIGFDPLTRSQLRMAVSCRTGEQQIGAIIVGLFVFGLACVFTLGQVVNWVEETRMSRAPGRHAAPISYWRPLLHVIGTLALGVTGYVMMSAWCN